MSRLKIFQVDAFTTRRFTGNPAAVMLMDAFPADAVLQAIAAENNLAETAFIVPHGRDYRLRWFTPTVEVPLCGHATLASAAVVMERLEPERTEVIFESASGPLTVTRSGGAYLMNFPARSCSEIEGPIGLTEALGARPIEVAWDGFNYIARLETSDQVRELFPNLSAIEKLECAGVLVTAKDGSEFDFVSRYFAPAKGIPEDPVTGAAHCSLALFWAPRLHKSEFEAFQASKRGGALICRIKGDRVELEGRCVFYLEGEATI